MRSFDLKSTDTKPFIDAISVLIDDLNQTKLEIKKVEQEKNLYYNLLSQIYDAAATGNKSLLSALMNQVEDLLANNFADKSQ